MQKLLDDCLASGWQRRVDLDRPDQCAWVVAAVPVPGQSQIIRVDQHTGEVTITAMEDDHGLSLKTQGPIE